MTALCAARAPPWNWGDHAAAAAFSSCRVESHAAAVPFSVFPVSAATARQLGTGGICLRSRQSAAFARGSPSNKARGRVVLGLLLLATYATRPSQPGPGAPAAWASPLAGRPWALATQLALADHAARKRTIHLHALHTCTGSTSRRPAGDRSHGPWPYAAAWLPL